MLVYRIARDRFAVAAQRFKMLDGTTTKEILTRNGKNSTQVLRLLRGLLLRVYPIQ